MVMRRWWALLLGAALFLASGSAGADLVFLGDGHVHQAESLATYERLPARGKEIHVHVQELDDVEWLLVDDFLSLPGCVGLYFPRSRSIYVTSGNWSVETFAHEWAHHVWFHALTDEERAAWREWWAANQELMPTAYATTSAVEGFAECYATVFLGAAVHPLLDSTMRQVVLGQ